MPQYKLSDGTSTYTLDSEYDLTDDELTEAAKQLFKNTTPVSQPQPQPQPQENYPKQYTGVDIYKDIMENQNLTPEQKEQEIVKRGQKEREEIAGKGFLEKGRVGLGTGLMAAGSLPIFNIPVVGTALGGALYNGGKAIAEGKKGKDIAKETGKGTLIGGTIDAALFGLGKTPVGKYIKQKSSEWIAQNAPKFSKTRIGRVLNRPIGKNVELKTEAKLLTPEEATQIEQKITKQPRVSSKVQPEVETPEVINLGGPIAKTEDLAKITQKEIPTMAQTSENITPEEQITKNIGNEIKLRQSAKTVESASGIKLEDEDILNYEVRHQQDLINKARSLSPEEKNNIIHSDRLDDEATAVRIAELQLAKENGQVPSTALLNKLVTSGTEQGQALSMRQQLNAYSPEGAILAIRKGNLEGVSKQAKTVIGNSEKIAKELQPLMETSPENAAVEAQFNKWIEEMPNKIKKQYSQKGDKLALMKAMEKHRVSMAKKEMAAIEKYSNQKVKEKAKQQLKEKLTLEREEAKAIKQLLKEEQKKHANIQKVLTKFGASEKASRSIIKELMTLKQNEGLTQENLATILDRAYGVKQISKQDLDEITKLTDAVANTAEGTREQDIARGYVDKFINEKIPKSSIKKVNSFRYQNMLNSPKSRMKDIITSAITAFDTNVVVPTFANTIDIGRVTLGKGLGKIYRPLGDFFGTQRAFAGPQIKAALGGLKKGASVGWSNAIMGIETPRSGLTYNYDLPRTAFAYKQLGNSWKDISNIVDTAKAIANNIPAVGEQVMNGLIRIPDRAFYETTYAQSLANQMKAAGVSEPTEVMVNQAVKEAKEAIFQEVSKISQFNNKVRETFNSIVPGLGNIEMPFPTTPGNLLGLGLKRTYGIPTAIARHITDFMKSGGEGLTQQQIRDNTNLAAQGILGSVPAAIGTAQGLGWLTGNLGNTDYKENEVSGLQPQSVVIPGTDYAISFRNTPMFSIPAAIRAAETRALVEGLEDVENSNVSPEAKQYAMVLANALLQSGSAATKAFTEQSAMKPLSDAIRMVSEGGYYSDDPKGEIQRAAEGLGEVAINTGLQLNPYSSLRNEWGNIKNPQAAELQTDNWIDYAGNRWKNSSITGREDLPPKYSALGTPVMRNNLETPIGRALSEAFDFGVRKYNREDTEKYRDLENFSKQAKKAKISGYKKLGVKKLERSVKLPDDTKIKLTNEQYSEAQRVYGKMQDYFKTTLLYDQNISNKKRVDDMKEYDTAAKQVALYSVLGDKYSVKKPSKYLNRVIKYYNENLYEK